MCQLFVNADPTMWETRLRSVRMHGFATSVRLEKIYWMLLEEIARRDGLSVAEILARLYEELLETHGVVENFASFLRVCCARYLMLQLAGDIPADLARPIAGLDARSILAREEKRLAAKNGERTEEVRRREAQPSGMI
jgi:predicted DNA-binding ribbon-helix-helix protein